jgi:hypothetical protein
VRVWRGDGVVGADDDEQNKDSVCTTLRFERQARMTARLGI